jgi:hypothetical protein
VRLEKRELTRETASATPPASSLDSVVWRATWIRTTCGAGGLEGGGGRGVTDVLCLGRTGIYLGSIRRLGSCALRPICTLLLGKETRTIGSYLNFI